jgi:peptidoglycan/xylan/chitin deacetylase (PgdA/CDA1 family)
LNHAPAVDSPRNVYGLAAAGSRDGLEAEINGGADAILGAGAGQPHWFRGATARYSAAAIALARTMGFRIAGYSLNGDGSSLLGANDTEKRIGHASDGDVILAHINQPSHAAGAGVVAGILRLKARGFAFARLSDVQTVGSDGTTD